MKNDKKLMIITDKSDEANVIEFDEDMTQEDLEIKAAYQAKKIIKDSNNEDMNAFSLGPNGYAIGSGENSNLKLQNLVLIVTDSDITKIKMTHNLLGDAMTAALMFLSFKQAKEEENKEDDKASSAKEEDFLKII